MLRRLLVENIEVHRLRSRRRREDQIDATQPKQILINLVVTPATRCRGAAA